MRIVSGKWRGKRIIAPKNLPTRPTTDFGKEGLFNILSNRFYFEDLKIIDLFAGTGNICYEFASRGVLALTAVDISKDCTRFIAKTSEELGIEIQTVQADCLKWIQRSSTSYDIVFADPPYDYEFYEDLARSIIERSMLSPDGTAVIEHSDETDISHLPGFMEQRRYGNVNFSFFSRLEDLDNE